MHDEDSTLRLALGEQATPFKKSGEIKNQGLALYMHLRRVLASVAISSTASLGSARGGLLEVWDCAVLALHPNWIPED